MADTYRQYLQNLANSGNAQAQLGLNWQGDDVNNANYGINPEFFNQYGADSQEARSLTQMANKYLALQDGFTIGKSNPVATPTSFGGSPTGSADGGANGADLAYLDDSEQSLRGMLDSSQRTLQNGLLQIGDSYDKEYGRTSEKRAAATAGYTTQREDTTRDKLGAIGKVNTGARTLADSVRRMLGLASGSNSSAYKEVAPNAIARDASIKRTSVNENYGTNLRNIDTAEQSSNTNFDQYIQDLIEQRKQKESGLREGVLQQEQGIYNDLGDIARQRVALQGGGYDAVRNATAPARTAISERQIALDNLFSQFRAPFQTKDVQAATPQLNDYTVDRSTLNAPQPNNPTGSPYTSFLRKRFSGA